MSHKNLYLSDKIYKRVSIFSLSITEGPIVVPEKKDCHNIPTDLMPPSQTFCTIYYVHCMDLEKINLEVFK